jgi:hypothetical protein
VWLPSFRKSEPCTTLHADLRVLRQPVAFPTPLYSHSNLKQYQDVVEVNERRHPAIMLKYFSSEQSTTVSATRK